MCPRHLRFAPTIEGLALFFNLLTKYPPFSSIRLKDLVLVEAKIDEQYPIVDPWTDPECLHIFVALSAQHHPFRTVCHRTYEQT